MEVNSFKILINEEYEEFTSKSWGVHQWFYVFGVLWIHNIIVIGDGNFLGGFRRG